MGLSVLENDELLLEISEHGAELSRIFDKKGGEERLHDANPAFWNRHAPVLFPMVGASFDKKYRYREREYGMGQHGFARDSDFKLVQKTDNSVTYLLKDNEKTLESYPFHFELYVTHILSGRTITVRWEVKNPSSDELLFNIGAHPAFLLGSGKSFSDVTLDFGSKKELTFYRIEDPGSGCIYADEPHTLKTDNGSVSLSNDFFDEGVYIFQNGSVDDVTLSVDGRARVRVSAEGFPYFGIWSKPGAPFICLEPWHGRTDRYGFKGELSEKEGIISLAPSGVFEASYDIVIY